MPLYSLLLVLVLLVGSPFWLFRLLTSGRYRAGLRQRLGGVPAELERLRGAPEVVWLHAVSVGEVLVATGLVRELRRARPGWTVAISTTTEAGQRVAKERFPEHPVFYMPLDLAVLVRRYLRVLRPRLLILMESEFWPNLMRESRRAGCTIAVANARISDRSFPRYLRLRRLWRPILAQVSLFLAQGEETAGRLRAIGVSPERVRVAGNLKFDLPEEPRGPRFEQVAAALPAGSPVLVAGSTLEGEEAMLLDAWAEMVRELPAAVMVLAPRHPRRFDTVAELVRSRGVALARATALGAGTSVANGGVLLLDTIGDLRAVYALATAAFVGGSLVDGGGHNPLEPARFGVPVIMGASVANFREVVRMLQQREAICVLEDLGALAVTLREMLAGSEAAEAMGQRGAEAVRQQTGAAERSAAALLSLLDEPGDAATRTVGRTEQ